MIYNNYSNVNLGEVELCLRFFEDNAKNRQQEPQGYFAIWKSLQIASRELTDPRLMHRSDARLYYPKMNEIIMRTRDYLKMKLISYQEFS